MVQLSEKWELKRLTEPNELIEESLSELSAVTDDLNELLVLLENSEDE